MGRIIQGPVLLIILDGWGIRGDTSSNAILLADTPNWDRICRIYPKSCLEAAGEAVGLRAGQMGNSNVGHLNLGAGRVVYQDLLRIDRAVHDGELQRNAVWLSVVDYLRGNTERTLHFIGLLSDGGVHSHQDHLHALISYAAGAGIRRLVVHAFLDGRDVPPRSALLYIDRLEKHLERVKTGTIASVSGRFYAMDRDERWDRTHAAYRALVHAEGLHASSAREAVEQAYARGESDEFVQPTIVAAGQGADLSINPCDAVVAFNFRADRMRQLTRALTEPGFDSFPRAQADIDDIVYVSMAQYHEDFGSPYLFAPLDMRNTLGEWVSQHGLTQLRIAETEKYAHVTFFLNGGREEAFPGEDRCLIPSPRVATYDLKPEMSAYEVTEEVLTRLDDPGYDLVVLNYANTDMVGHTGNLEAAIQAVQHVDRCLGRVVFAVVERQGAALIVADHGNAEQMADTEHEQPHTAHTTNPVPCILVSEAHKDCRLRDGILASVAPTLLELLSLPKPPEMTSQSLIFPSNREDASC